MAAYHLVLAARTGPADELDLEVVVVCNGAYAGGGMNFAPGARTDDGLLDVLAHLLVVLDALAATPLWEKRTRVVHTGIEALDAAIGAMLDATPDAILLDVGLPDGSGRDRRRRRVARVCAGGLDAE